MKIRPPQFLRYCNLAALLLLFAQTHSRAATFSIPQSDLPWRIAPTEISTTPLGDGSFLVSGDFSLLNDQHIGSVALLQKNGTLAPAFPGLELAGIQIPLAKRLTTGDIIAYIDIDSTSFTNNENRPRQHPFETDLGPRKVNFIYERPAAILDDGNLVFTKNSSVLSYVDGLLTTVTVSSIHYASIDETGEIAHREYNQRFSQRGYVRQVLPLTDGKLLLLASHSGEPGQLLRLLPDLTPDTAFNPSLLSSEIFELHDPKLAFASNGDLFVFSTLKQYEPHPAPYLLRLNDDGSIDPTFTLTTPFFTTPDTQIQATPDGYRLLNVYPASTDLRQPAITLDRSGQTDDAFEIDDSSFDSNSYAATYIGLDEATTLAAIPSSPLGSLQWFQIDSSGNPTPINPGQLSSIPSLQPNWTENQELIYATSAAVHGEENYTNWKNGVARSDGSQRIFLSISGSQPQFTTPRGNFISRDSATVDFQGTTRENIIAPSETKILAQSHDGLLYAQIPDPQNPDGHSRTYVIARLYPGGGLDPTFELFPLGYRSDAMVQPYHDKLYIVSYSTGNYSLQLNRILLDGAFDPTFQPVALDVFPTQVQPTPSGIYLASHSTYQIYVNNVLKPLGARLGIDGALDPTYRPEGFLDRDQSNPNENRTITEDGHVYLFAARRGSAYTAQTQLWHIPPSGDPERVEPYTQWRYPYIDVSRQGSLFISGTQITSNGSEQTSRIYHTRPTAHSFPKRVYLATEAKTIKIPVTFPNADSLSFQWLQNGTPILGGNSASISISPTEIIQPTTFTLVATDSTVDTQEIGPFYVLNETTEVPELTLRKSPNTLFLSCPTLAPNVAQLLRSTDLENWQPVSLLLPQAPHLQQMPINLEAAGDATFWKLRVLKLD